MADKTEKLYYVVHAAGMTRETKTLEDAEAWRDVAERDFPDSRVTIEKVITTSEVIYDRRYDKPDWKPSFIKGIEG